MLTFDDLDWACLDVLMQNGVVLSGWVREIICFGNPFRFEDTTNLFYCGNHCGLGGMGYAELDNS